MKLHQRLRSHLKLHHKKYLFGVFWSFAIVKMVILFAGFFGILRYWWTFAINNELDLNSENITNYCSTDSTYCYLNDYGFTSIAPNTFINHTMLTTIYLYANQLTSIDADAFNWLSTLTYLDLSDNQLTTLPESIWNLTGLVELYMHNNQLTSLPESIG
ncbi:MAG: hypothetical protein ACD_80C00142G0001, partial [uncultured bacterium (gcode 4)]